MNARSRIMLLLLVSVALIPLSLFVFTSASAQGYGSDITTTGNAIDCGHNTTLTSDLAFDDISSNYWGSSQNSNAVSGAACIGQNFGSTAYHVRRIGIRQNQVSDHGITSVIVQSSTVSGCASGWTTVETVNGLTKDNAMNYFNKLCYVNHKSIKAGRF